MPELIQIHTEAISLCTLLEELPQYPENHDFGLDINKANQILLSEEFDISEKVQCLFDWFGRNQPCLFGRMSAFDSKGLSVNICWITENEIALGDLYLYRKIQAARRAWKDRCEKGESHGFLVFFNSNKLTYAKPSIELLDVCKHVSDLYFVEYAPTEADVIYTEAVPLRNTEGKLSVFKAGANIFYSGSHRTRNHDRRIPGGLMISINSVGHYANSLILRGLTSSLSEAVEYVLNIAWRSIGNGGIGDEKMHSTTWHNHESLRPSSECPMKLRPNYIPIDFSIKNYSGLYHTDVLSPISVTVDSMEINELDGNYKDFEVWKELGFDYLTEHHFKQWESNYGFFHGHPVCDEAKYHNPWVPVRVYNKSGLTEREKMF
jgi:hypothetical protein